MVWIFVVGSFCLIWHSVWQILVSLTSLGILANHLVLVAIVFLFILLVFIWLIVVIPDWICFLCYICKVVNFHSTVFPSRNIFLLYFIHFHDFLLFCGIKLFHVFSLLAFTQKLPILMDLWVFLYAYSTPTIPLISSLHSYEKKSHFQVSLFLRPRGK